MARSSLALLLAILLLADPARAGVRAELTATWERGNLVVAWGWAGENGAPIKLVAPTERACLMIADTPEGVRHLLTCEAGPATLRYAGVDVNYQPRAGRWLLLVPAERIFDPPLAAAPVPPGPHTVAAPLVRKDIDGGVGE